MKHSRKKKYKEARKAAHKEAHKVAHKEAHEVAHKEAHDVSRKEAQKYNPKMSNLENALRKVRIPTVEDSSFLDLPSSRGDPLWRQMQVRNDLTDLELGALKNKRCEGVNVVPSVMKMISI